MKNWIALIVGGLVLLAVIGYFSQSRERFDGYPRQPNYNKVIYSGLADATITRI